MKRDKHDSVISDLIRYRANWTCQKCGHISAQGQITGRDQFIQCSHFNGRGTGNVCRYDTDLLLCLCASCHGFVENRPYEHTQLMESIVGSGLLDIKKESHSKPYKFKPGEKDEMYEHYKKELQRVKLSRMEGRTGLIEVTSWF